MSEWSVVTVVIALVGLVATVTTPVVRLNSAITRLTTLVDQVAKRLDRLEQENSSGHRRLWEKAQEQSERLTDHERRLQRLEEEKHEN